MSTIDQLLSRARLLKDAPEDVIPHGPGIRHHPVAGAAYEASLWPPEDADPVDISDDEDTTDVYDAAPGTAADDLHTLCEAVVTHTATSLNDFVTDTLPAPTGARAVGCILSLAENSDSARFWWQYAAGAGDNTAHYCLYLHHLARGEDLRADWWRSQTRITTDPTAYTVIIPTPQDLIDSVVVNARITTILRTLRALAGPTRRWSATVADVTSYVLSAVTAATRVENSLPVPQEFAADVRAVLADAARHHIAPPGPGHTQQRRLEVGRPTTPWLEEVMSA